MVLCKSGVMGCFRPKSQRSRPRGADRWYCSGEERLSLEGRGWGLAHLVTGGIVRRRGHGNRLAIVIGRAVVRAGWSNWNHDFGIGLGGRPQRAGDFD